MYTLRDCCSVFKEGPVCTLRQTWRVNSGTYGVYSQKDLVCTERPGVTSENRLVCALRKIWCEHSGTSAVYCTLKSPGMYSEKDMFALSGISRVYSEKALVSTLQTTLCVL